MSDNKKMTDEEFSQMITLLSRFIDTEMDQFESWKFESEYGVIYVNISMYAAGDSSAYTDVTKAIKK
ncbi:hypothetical protein N480_00450 [Pseudoalteromonas luteoviolacea S2607]|uniref:hypothetical protein n=1 Tax=Pseudoalteromonas luteoviolacea TaxID=43657 RepID=UPI0007B04BCB|nr:hypothetical protein [Pseudoalteromonas luteoviolacea]KZN39331.1 hypothetical protein N480_00450 [Pseudoalteromonas luteoviolacea S2607]